MNLFPPTIPSIHLPASWSARGLLLAGWFAAIVVLGAVLPLMPVQLAIAIAACGAGIALVVPGWPRIPMLLMVLVVSINRYSVDVQGFSVSAERAVLPVLAIGATAAALSRSDVKLRAGTPHVGWAIYVATLTLSSAIAAPDRAQSLRLTLLVAITSLPLWLVPMVTARNDLLRWAYRALLAAVLVEAAFGVLTMALYLATGIEVGLRRDSFTGLLTPYGTQREGDSFGSFVAMGFVAYLAWVVGGRIRFKWVSPHTAALTLLALAVLVSFSRGAWLGAAGGAIAVVALAPSARRQSAVAAGGAILVVALILGLAIGGFTYVTGFLTRLISVPGVLVGTTVDTRYDDAFTRVLILRNFTQSPIFGSGAGSLGERYSYVTINAPAWNGNLELHVLNDAGILGLIGVATIFLSITFGLWRRVRRAGPGHDQSVAIGCFGMLVVMLIAFQATEVTYLAYTWVIIGMAWSALEKVQPSTAAEPTTATTGEPALKPASPLAV